MSLQFRETPDKVIVNFTDAKILDEGRIQEIGSSLLDICKCAGDAAKRLVVDFRGVQSMSSAMIGKLVLLNKMARQYSLDLRMANISKNVLEVFKLTGLNKVFRFDDDDPDLPGAGVPIPKPPSTLDGQAEPPSK
jgi:anti-sigma B factor antagonist